MHVLEKQGVPKEHVFAWARYINGVTLLHPKPSITDEPLDAPAGWEDRVLTGASFDDRVSQMFKMLGDWGQCESVERVVVILLGTGQSMSVFSGNGELDPASFGSIQSKCGNKPVLIVLDFENSAIFAASAAAKTKGDVFYLASGKFVPGKTAVVLCGVDGRLADAPGSGNIRYAIYSTMFHRALFQLVVFTGSNPKLTEIAELLNGLKRGSRGFKSESMSCGCGCDDMHLRDFFGDQVDPSALLGILAPRPSGGFIDDVDHFVDTPLKRGQGLRPLLNEFIRVEFDPEGQVQVVAHGRFRSDHPVHSAVRRHINLGPSLPPLPRRFSDRNVVGKAIELLAQRKMDERGGDSCAEPPPPEGIPVSPVDSCGEPPPPEAITVSPVGWGVIPPDADFITASRNDSRAIFLRLTDEERRKMHGIHGFLLRENGATPKSVTELHVWIIAHLDLSDLEGWCGALRAAQEALCKEFPRDRMWRASEV
jgi:hypothetical protein